MIKFVSGDILKTKSHYLAQGVAIESPESLGTGLALKVSTKWPDAQKHFKQFTRSQNFLGGDIFVVRTTKSRPGIIYIGTQPDMYHASLSYLNRGLRKLARYCEKHEIESVSLPKIGTGLGKLDWEEEVKPLLMRHLEDQKTSFFVYEDFKDEDEK
jgi:O-acetyl-ADP-ribose deacetylase (regulator of RNase III)